MEVDINIPDKAHYTMSSTDAIGQLAKTLNAPRETIEEAFRRFPLKDGATKDQIHAVNRQRKNYIQMHKPVEDAPTPKPMESVENPDDNTWTVVKKKVRVKKHKSDEQLEAETQAYINNPLEPLYDSDGNEHNVHLNDIGSRF